FAAAKGLALALDIPLVPVPTLDCVAFPFSFWPGIVLPVIDAKSRSFFTALYRGGERLGPYLDTGMDELIKIVAAAKSAAAGIEPAGPESAAEPAGPGSGDPGPESPPLLITGPGAVMVYGPLVRAFPGAVLDPLHGRGRAAELLNLAAKRSILDNKRVSGGPLYLRKSDAELNG
ncbi:MAG: hypothetical protein LBD09_03750, partial [Treponema sp.]|nr:hypothetical protein [Treponema sp.]